MAKSKKRKMTTEEALESLLGKKAAKRLRRLATEIAEADRKDKVKKNKAKKKVKRKRTR
jgi:hypothetical protein